MEVDRPIFLRQTKIEHAIFRNIKGILEPIIDTY